MFNDKETLYWKEEYRKGNLDDVDMPGEIRCILDGSAERIGKQVCCQICSIMFIIFSFITIHCLIQQDYYQIEIGFIMMAMFGSIAYISSSINNVTGGVT